MLKVAVDAGHGLYTAGKRAPDDSMREFHLTNAISLMLGKILENDFQNVSVLHPYDTSGKTDTGLTKRTNSANAWGADVFVSIHGNAAGNGWSTARGIETFTQPGASAKSKQLSKNVQTQLIRHTGFKDRGTKEKNLAVTRQTRMPAILTECGFYTNKEELAIMKTDKFRRTCAEAIAAGIAETFGLKRKKPDVSTSGGSKPTAPTGGGGKMAHEIFDPQVGAIKESTLRVLGRLAAKDPNGIGKEWKEKLDKGELTTAQATGLLYVAFDRQLFDK